jgi:hypothetical protein
VTWQAFIIAHGRRAAVHHLATILGVSEPDVERVRRSVPCAPGTKRAFPDLFAQWHGRPPRDEEWPAPRRIGGGYEWQAPEMTLLASMVGTLGREEISQVLTERLQRLTGDVTARRDRNAVLIGIQRSGLQMSDVVGGITVKAAAREIGAQAIVYHEIRMGRLQTFRAGRYLVIPRDAWEAWKATRVFPPAGFVRLATLKKPLGIRSDKLSEWARAGYVPSAIRCTPVGIREHSTKFGMWYVDPKVAKHLIATRRAGRPMPWWRKPEPYNLKVTWNLYDRRRHPEACDACRTIWGPSGAPTAFDDYAQRYPPLDHGAKRHLTRPWSSGWQVQALADHLGIAHATIIRAIQTGTLRARKIEGRWFITKTDATRWKSRKCPNGRSFRSWLGVRTACRAYGFSRAELLTHVKAGRIRLKVGLRGAMRDVEYVLKQQVRELRDSIGYSEREAARRVGVSVSRLRVLLRGTEWRSTARIPPEAVRTCQRRLEAENGVSLAEAARILGKRLSWVRQEILAGTIRPLRTAWDKKRLYVTLPMFDRLIAAALNPRERPRWTSEWLHVSDAATFACVSVTTVDRWGDAGDLRRRQSSTGFRYHRRSLIARARTYWTWAVKRYKRAAPPDWLTAQEAA